jgi:uncharacterized protein YkwD
MNFWRLTVLCLGVGMGLQSAAFAAGQEFPVPPEANQYIKDQIDAFRAQNGAAPLKMSNYPNSAADHYAHFLAQNNLTGHTADGKDPAARVTAVGGKFCSIWENVHDSWTSPNREDPIPAMAKAMDFWIHSPGHRANMLSKSTRMGIGVAGAQFGDKWYYKQVVVFLDTSCLPNP